MNTKSTAIILSDESTWPLKVLDCLNKHHDIFYLGKAILAGIQKGSFPEKQYDEAHVELREALLPFQLKGYHCTKLTESEIFAIINNGMSLQNLDSLSRRIDDLVSHDIINSKIANKLKTKNQTNNKVSELYFCFYPPKKAGNGVASFFRLWGGEALYGHHEKDLEIGEVLRKIGNPCIIEADIPVSFLSKDSELIDRTVNTFLKNRGYVTNKYCDLETYSQKNISSSNIKKIFQFPDPDFIELSGCKDWDDPLI
jgi:hypothetical protein